MSPIRQIESKKRTENDSNSNESEQLSNGDDNSAQYKVSLEWLGKKFGSFLELFLIFQFGAGIFLFFAGIFFLVWAVAPTASLQAGSYMLIAFFIIGRALLGIIGYYTKNFCLIFSYGVILLVTFVLRTIMIMVRLKITVSPDHRLNIPPLLQAAPGAMATYIEMICAVFEFLQTLGTFSFCWIMNKQTAINKEEDESKLTLNIANQVARYLYQQETVNNVNKVEKTADENPNDNNQITSNKTEHQRKSSIIDILRKPGLVTNLQQQFQRRFSMAQNDNNNNKDEFNKNNDNTMVDNDTINCKQSGRPSTMSIAATTSATTSANYQSFKSILHYPNMASNIDNSTTGQHTMQNYRRPDSTFTTQTHHFDSEQQRKHYCPAKFTNHQPTLMHQEHYQHKREYYPEKINQKQLSGFENSTVQNKMNNFEYHEDISDEYLDNTGSLSSRYYSNDNYEKEKQLQLLKNLHLARQSADDYYHRYDNHLPNSIYNTQNFENGKLLIKLN